MAKYLPYYGWDPVVLTNKWDESMGSYDPEIVSGIPSDLAIYKAGKNAPENDMLLNLQRRIYHVFNPHRQPKEFVDSAIALVPKIIKENRIRVIWATFPPLCNLWLASYISQKEGIPWVADLRDIIMLPFYEGIGATLMYPIRLRAFHNIIKKASEVVAVSEGISAIVKKQIKRNVLIVPNGYDPDIIRNEKIDAFPMFELIYTGGMEWGRSDSLKTLLDALQVMIEKKEIEKQKVAISFYGRINTGLFLKYKRHPCFSIMRFNGQVPRKHALEKQRHALILLLISTPGTGMMTSKIFEYLVARRPIMAIPRDIDHCERVIAETQSGVSCSTVEEIRTQLLKWYKEWESTGNIQWNGSIEKIGKYSRKAQVSDYAKIMDIVLNAKQY